MLHNVTAATHKGGYLIEIEFDDGSRGVVDFSKYLTRGSVFERFKDPEIPHTSSDSGLTKTQGL